MLAQLEEGLKLYGFLEEVRSNPDLFLPLFVADTSSMFEISSGDYLKTYLSRTAQDKLKKLLKRTHTNISVILLSFFIILVRMDGNPYTSSEPNCILYFGTHP